MSTVFRESCFIKQLHGYFGLYNYHKRTSSVQHLTKSHKYPDSSRWMNRKNEMFLSETQRIVKLLYMSIFLYDYSSSCSESASSFKYKKTTII